MLAHEIAGKSVRFVSAPSVQLLVGMVWLIPSSVGLCVWTVEDESRMPCEKCVALETGLDPLSPPQPLLF